MVTVPLGTPEINPPAPIASPCSSGTAHSGPHHHHPERQSTVFSRTVVGWQVATSLYTDLALDALDMAVFRRRRTGADLTGLIHHSDRGVQYRAIRYTERLSDADAVASVGSKGDSYDNALAEAFNSLFKAELIRNKGPWTGINDVEIAVAQYIDWFNRRRLHGELGHVTPAEHEAAHDAAAPSASLQKTS